MSENARVSIIDSHTGGEPTRVVISGGPDLGGGSVAGQLAIFREHHDEFRRAVINEPRGHEVLVGALLCAPSDSTCAAGVIFFNNVGYLGMCGHGLIGLVITLAHLGRVGKGPVRIETPVGIVEAQWDGQHSVSVSNVASYRHAHEVKVEVSFAGLKKSVTGDVAWGGNWFFLAKYPDVTLELANLETLLAIANHLRQAVNANGFPEVDHVELFGPPHVGGHARNFVLCPGGAYDRSPCGTGTSAKLACLAADNTLEENTAWVQESIIGSCFTGTYRWLDRARGIIAPTITGSAFLTSEATLLFDSLDPFRHGIR